MVAGGAGGGGVFVAILIAVSGYSPHESIPISKFIIFITAIATYIINTFWERSSGVIDYALVRAIVPLSLAGTLIGVLINTSANDVVLLVLLSCLLLALMYKTLLLAISRYNDEHEATALHLTTPDAQIIGVVKGHTSEPSTVVEDGKPEPPPPQSQSPAGAVVPGWEPRNSVMVVLVPIVVACGVVSKLDSLSSAVSTIIFALPILACVGVTVFFHRSTTSTTTNTPSLWYPLMGLLAGIAAGLFGIGGGLIYAPVLLHMGVRPPVAVAVSSTGVLFASASTAMQYLFMGRIPLLTALFFSIFGIASSVTAAKLVAVLSILTGRHWPLFAIVASAVGISTAATLAKTFMLL